MCQMWQSSLFRKCKTQNRGKHTRQVFIPMTKFDQPALLRIAVALNHKHFVIEIVVDSYIRDQPCPEYQVPFSDSSIKIRSLTFISDQRTVNVHNFIENLTICRKTYPIHSTVPYPYCTVIYSILIDLPYTGTPVGYLP